MAIENDKILKQYLLLCEGIDAMNFFISMLNSAAFSDDARFSNEIQILNFGGNNQLNQFLQLLPLREGYDKVKAVMIVRDAEDSYEKAALQIQSALRNNHFGVPEKAGLWQEGNVLTSFLLFPSLDESNENGALEDLCWSMINEEDFGDISENINSFLGIMKSQYGYSHPRIFKNRLHTYFSVTDKFVANKLGEAAKAQAFDWGSERLICFKRMFLEIFEEDLSTRTAEIH